MSKAHRKDCSKICWVDILSTTWVTAKTEYARGWEIVQLVQHGQASIERGFFPLTNKLQVWTWRKTLVPRRIIKDHVNAIGGVEKLNITKELLQSCSAASSRYRTNLEEKKPRSRQKQKIIKAAEELLVLKRRDTSEADVKLFNDNSEKVERLSCLAVWDFCQRPMR